MSIFRFVITGILAGAISAYCFALIHGFFISNIWFSLPVLLVAGAICGLCLGWTYRLLFEAPSIHTWLQYNALYVGMFVLIGCLSVLVYQPVTTLAAVMASDAPPDYLFKQAMPVTIVSTIIMAAIIGRLYARTLAHYAAVLLTSAVLVILLRAECFSDWSHFNSSQLGLPHRGAGRAYPRPQCGLCNRFCGPGMEMLSKRRESSPFIRWETLSGKNERKWDESDASQPTGICPDPPLF